MTRFLSPARSADHKPAPPVNGTPLPAPRTGTLAPWIACGGAAFALLLLIFVLQNGQPSEVHFLGLDGRLPTGVALLLATVAGVLLVAVPAVVRLVQARTRRSRHPLSDLTADVVPTASPGPTS